MFKQTLSIKQTLTFECTVCGRSLAKADGSATHVDSDDILDRSQRVLEYEAHYNQCPKCGQFTRSQQLADYLAKEADWHKALERKAKREQRRRERTWTLR